MLAPATTGLFGLMRSVIMLVSLLVTLYVLSPVMAGVVVVGAVPALLARISLSKRRVGMIAGMSTATRRQVFYSSLITDVRAAKEVRLLALDGFLRARMLDELTDIQSAERRVDRRELGVQAGLALLSALVAGLGLVWAVWSAARGELSLGDVSAFVAAVAGTQAALASLVDSIASAHQALLHFGYYAAVLDLPDDLPTPAPPVALPALRRGIELEDVWFRYDDGQPWVLRGVTLTIPHGGTVALVGLNGAGKSTLIKLLCRFYDPTRGSIRWDGVDLRDVAPADLRARMGVLFQDFMNYDLTAAENIGLGDLTHLGDAARIRTAAESADIHGAITAMPRGYDTLLSRQFLMLPDSAGEASGVVLSGGQWQRLALARTFMRSARDLMILDEPSAGLDAEAEYEIHQRLRRHRTGQTSLLVSHRLSAVRDAGLIVVLAGGRVVEQGSHDELVDADTEYARLFALQASGYADEPTPPAGRDLVPPPGRALAAPVAVRSVG